jgi:hypothetical protein
MRRLALMFLTLLSLLSLMACAGAAARDGGGSPPPFPKVAGTWWHAEINVRIKREYHTLVLDRGRIVQVSPTQMTVRERDGSLVPVALNDQTLVVIRGRAASVAALRLRMDVQAMRIDDGPAVRVRSAA